MRILALGMCLLVTLTIPEIVMADKKTGQQKEELSKLRIELDQTEKRLDSLRKAEAGLLGKLSNLDQRISLDKEVISKLTTKVNQLRSQRKATEKLLTLRSAKLDGAKSAFTNQLQKLYLDTYSQPLAPSGFVDAPHSPGAYRGLYYASLNNHTQSEIKLAEDSAKSAQTQLSGVTRSANEAADLKKKRKISSDIRKSQRKKSESKLTKVRQDKETTADELLYLSEAAKQMSELVARLEQAERERERSGTRSPVSASTGLFTARKGSYKSPIQGGKIISNYGWKTNSVTNLKSFASGIEIQGKPNYNVRAISAGVVVYIGSLRDYGKFVIVAHDDGYYTTYGGLGKVKVSLDQRIPEREPVGVTADGFVRFEIRHGKEAVDPIRWLDFSQLR